MATQVQATGSAPGAIDQLQRLIERFGLIAAGLVAIAGSLATFWTDHQPLIRWSVPLRSRDGGWLGAPCGRI